MSAIPVEFLGIGVSDDGERMTLVARDPNGAEIAWSLPSSSANPLIASLIQAAGQADRTRGQNPKKTVFGVEWWTVGIAPDGGIVLSFRIPGGMELSFHLPQDPALQLRQALDTSLEQRPTPGPETRH